MPNLSQTIRQAIRDADVSRYRIAQATGIAESTLSRFMAGSGLNMGSIDALAEFLGLELVPKHAGRAERGKGNAWRRA